MYRKPNIVTTMKVRRLEWSGLVGMSDGRTVKIVFLGKRDESRKAGTPKLMWLDCIENDLTSFGCQKMAEESSPRRNLLWLHDS
jgi:hypothetical protein